MFCSLEEPLLLGSRVCLSIEQSRALGRLWSRCFEYLLSRRSLEEVFWGKMSVSRLETGWREVETLFSNLSCHVPTCNGYNKKKVQMCEFEIVFRYFDLCYQVVTYRRQLLILPVLLFHLKENVTTPCSWPRWSKGEWYQYMNAKKISFLQHVEVWPFVPGSWLSSPSSSAEQSVWRSRRPGGTELLATL